MTCQHHTCEEKKEKHIDDSPLLHHGHHSITKKELTEIILTLLWNAAR
jgi:hypothetical protein